MRTPARHLLNRGLLLAIIGLIVWLVLWIPTRSPPAEQAPAPAPAAAVPMGSPLSPVQVTAPGGAFVIPVSGVEPSNLVDTFTAARANGRVHNAMDIMAARGTPVLAAAEGTIEKLYFSHGGGGITVYVRSPDQRWIYYYAHLEGYAPGLAEGQQVRPGALLGFVGSTGSASPEAPHLHFAVNAMAPDERWWQGTPVNPFPLLTGQSGR